MEKMFFVRAGKDEDLRAINMWLQKGGKVKNIVAVPGNSESEYSVYAYVVIEIKE